VTVHQLSRRDARRIAVRAQLLDSPRPTGLLDVVRHLTFVQLDPIAAVAPSADLVAWSRIGSRYLPAQLVGALERDRTLFGSSYSPADLRRAVDDQTLVELHALLRPPEDTTLYRADMAVWPGNGEQRDWQQRLREWIKANDACRRDILDRLESSGPLPSRELPDTCEVPWDSSGWTNSKNITKLLEFMVARGEVAVAGRQGRDRLWDLASRVYPDEPIVSADDALRIRNERRLRALGIARATGTVLPGEPATVGDAGEPAVVDGVKGEWRVDPFWLDQSSFSGRAALLSPFDRLVHDRKRALEIFDYDYQLEMYKPAAKRRWGYYALPILYGDRLVGKLDAKADRKAGTFRVNAVHEDIAFNKTMTAAVNREIRDLSRWLELDLVLPE
jgi:uncharacterized protein YcaQ